MLKLEKLHVTVQAGSCSCYINWSLVWCCIRTKNRLKESCSLLFQANPNCLLIVTPKGGHLGWVAGDEAPFGCPWTDPIVMEYLEYLQSEKNSSTKNNIPYDRQGVSEASAPHLTVHVQT